MSNIINIKDVCYYTKCPLYYKYKNNTRLNINRVDLKEKYNNVLLTSIFTYLYRIQCCEIATVRDLTQSFMKLWMGDKYSKDKKEIIYSEPYSWRDTLQERRKSGLQALIYFNDFLKDNEVYPILINEDYEVPITKSITLTGKIHLLYQDKEGKIKLLHILTDDTGVPKPCIDKDLELTASMIGCSYLCNLKIDELQLYSLHKKKVLVTKRNTKNLSVFKQIILNVYTCIRNNIYYPSVNTKCNKCLYFDVCCSRTGLI